MDQNVDYMTAVLACEYTDGTVHYFDEIRQSNSNTESMAKAMKAKHPQVNIVYPDPAGSARSTTSHRSDHAILRDYGYSVRAKKSHPSHIDRLNALNRKLVDASGNVGMTVEPKCKYLIKDLETEYNGYSFPFEPIADELYRVTKKGGILVWVVGDYREDSIYGHFPIKDIHGKIVLY